MEYVSYISIKLQGKYPRNKSSLLWESRSFGLSDLPVTAWQGGPSSELWEGAGSGTCLPPKHTAERGCCLQCPHSGRSLQAVEDEPLGDLATMSLPVKGGNLC